MTAAISRSAMEPLTAQPASFVTLKVIRSYQWPLPPITHSLCIDLTSQSAYPPRHLIRGKWFAPRLSGVEFLSLKHPVKRWAGVMQEKKGLSFWRSFPSELQGNLSYGTSMIYNLWSIADPRAMGAIFCQCNDCHKTHRLKMKGV